ncbi:hypothetical protein SODALDRAFT_83212 [Sodiomyces alkalinus F11]|uniref:Myb-like domain-containing protein n=1 Tax=Sodiomyces alkalinus (strain CBS 110278 / VKM F-3762 / F11) TaxID=1314773 RepID=A0A3N2PJY4_SODAK|nr:hypothetical protein SODALDRAFT_83212 [Sodiomyces alkalinus F11]ROT34694.1 hypothetical protein SODALDRAFT_83212 [Sodiomyces alkalinus F11]
MSFIEPRLIHLLNDSTTPHLSHTELPSLTEGSSEPADRPFPVEPTANHFEDQARISICSVPGSHTAHGVGVPLLRPGSGVEDGFLTKDTRRGDKSASDRSRIPLELLLREPSTQPWASDQVPPHFVPDSQDDTASKKRHRTAATKEDLLHLPQPVKKQKASSQSLLPPMPPIINGLHEPPPNAALFPPIAPNAFDGSKGGHRSTAMNYSGRHEETLARMLPTNAPTAKPAETPTKAEQEKGPVKSRKKAMKPRRKWSEAETKHLLLGVDRHGVGKWTDILADPDFQFNNRTAGDLKDRFRTCCPNELRKGPRDEEPTSPADAMPTAVPTSTGESKNRPKTGLLSENILIDTDAPYNSAPVQSRSDDAEAEPKSRRTRAHRKNMEDLAELGIHGPFKKSHRRERRPFSEEDDRLILEGLYKYGPAWTKIQRDPNYRLAGRQPTDLRDRVRNKYRDVYLQVEKGLLHAKDGMTLEPSIRMAISNALQPTKLPALDHPPSQPCSRDDSSRWPLSVLDNGENPGTSQYFDSSEPAPSALLGNAGEMDIARLLLD